MPSATHLFYLAVFSLLRPSHASRDFGSGTRTLSPRPDVCAFEPSATVSDACASYKTLDELNIAIQPHLRSITQDTDFFSYYRLNLYNKVCPFWSDENGMCGNIACAVNTIEDEKDIPLSWRAHELGRLQGPKARHPEKRLQEERKAAGDSRLAGELGEHVAESCVMEPEMEDCDDRDYCVLEDEADLASGGDYVSLVGNRERFTGYVGPGPQEIWENIYRENCFSKPTVDKRRQKKPASTKLSPLDGLGAGKVDHRGAAAQGLRSVMRGHGVQQAIAGSSENILDVPFSIDDECLEKRVFYRVISGMHASISSHLCYEHLNQTTGEWGPNVACYEERLKKHPERLSNLYFNYALLVRAVSKARTHMRAYNYCSADPYSDARTKEMVLALADALPSGTEVFDESHMFQTDYEKKGGLVSGGPELKEDFRARFRNVSRIMDCVGCDKCRLWGKLQTQGYGTAMKVLFEFDERDSSRDPPLRRTELVALVNTLDRVSHSLSAVMHFEAMIGDRERAANAFTGQYSLNSETAADDEGQQKEPATPAGYPVVPTPKGQGDPPQRTQSPGESPYNADNDEDEAEDDHFPDFLRMKNRPNYDDMTTSQIVRFEIMLVLKTAGFVVNSWMTLPGKCWRIFVFESTRLWDFWIGLPVQPRSWSLRVPRDEL